MVLWRIAYTDGPVAHSLYAVAHSLYAVAHNLYRRDFGVGGAGLAVVRLREERADMAYMGMAYIVVACGP